MSLLAATSWIDRLGDPQVLVASTGALTVVLTALFGTGSGRRRARQERYSIMVATLAGWAELPFRVRRRMSDDSDAIAVLVDRAHHLQEQMVLDAAELAAECPWLAARYEASRSTIQHEAAAHLNDAWSTPASGRPTSMNLSGWGPTGLDQAVVAFRYELRFRFGWRRAISPARVLFRWQRRKRTAAAVSRRSQRPDAEASPAD
jgi:hypothetical protein